jgi:hypothetical protein
MATDQDWSDNFIYLIMFNPINYYPGAEPLRAIEHDEKCFHVHRTRHYSRLDSTLFLVMQSTGRIRWKEKFAPPQPPEPLPPPAAVSAV